jgi:hypothetical protein
MYRWLWTMAFVSGELPSILVFILALACLLFFTFFMTRLGLKGRSSKAKIVQCDASTTEETKQRPAQVTSSTIVALIFALNITLVGTVNGLYLWSTLIDLSSVTRIWIQFAVGFFSFVWSVVIRRGLPEDLIESKDGLWLLTCLSIANTVIIPCLVTSFSSPSCYQVSLLLLSPAHPSPSLAHLSLLSSHPL